MADSVRIVVGTLVQAIKAASEYKDPLTWELAPVNRRDGGTRKWYGVRMEGGTVPTWCPRAQGGAAASISIAEEVLQELGRSLPEATMGMWVVRFFNGKAQVLDPEIRIDPRHGDEPTAQAPPQAQGQPAAPQAPPPWAWSAGDDPRDRLISQMMAQQERLFNLGYGALQHGGAALQQGALALQQAQATCQGTADTALRVAQTAADDREKGAKREQELLEKNQGLRETNTGLANLNAQLENENAGAKVLGEIYGREGGAAQFNELIHGVFAGVLDAVQSNGSRRKE